MIEALIFDKDGTLFDFNATWGKWADQMIAQETSGDPRLIDRLSQALGFDQNSKRFLPGSLVIASTAGAVVDAIIAVLPHLDRDEAMDRLYRTTADVEQVEALPLLAYFEGLKAQGYKIGIATNDAEAPARCHLERAGIVDLFDFIAGYDSGYGAKPTPGQLLGFCEALDVAPAACAMIGDSTHDLEAGQAAGMRRIGVLTGPAPRSEIEPFADVVLDDIGQIPGWLKEQGIAKI